MLTGEPPSDCGPRAFISGISSAEHDVRVADLYLGVARSPPSGPSMRNTLRRAERLLVKLDRRAASSTTM
jgi:hypothetical protein